MKMNTCFHLVPRMNVNIPPPLSMTSQQAQGQLYLYLLLHQYLLLLLSQTESMDGSLIKSEASLWPYQKHGDTLNAEYKMPSLSVSVSYTRVLAAIMPNMQISYRTITNNCHALIKLQAEANAALTEFSVYCKRHEIRNIPPHGDELRMSTQHNGHYC